MGNPFIKKNDNAPEPVMFHGELPSLNSVTLTVKNTIDDLTQIIEAGLADIAQNDSEISSLEELNKQLDDTVNEAKAFKAALLAIVDPAPGSVGADAPQNKATETQTSDQPVASNDNAAATTQVDLNAPQTNNALATDAAIIVPDATASQ